MGPAHDARAVDEHRRGVRDVASIGPRGGVTKPVRVDRPEVRIREEREVEPGIAGELGVRLGPIDDDAHDGTATAAQLLATQLQTLQLRDAEGSPMAAIEDEEQRLAGEVVEMDDVAFRIGE